MFAMIGAQAKELLGPLKPLRELSETEAQRYEAQRARTLRRLDLEDRITKQQAEVNAGTAYLVELVNEHLAEDFWKDHDGLTSPATFLTWKLGQTPSEAARILEVATSLEDRSLIKESFASGELSFPQVKILVSVAEPETEGELVELARNLSGAQLARFAGHYRSALRLQQDSAHKERYLSTRHNDDGSWTITGSLASEHGAVIDKALEAAMDEMRKEDTPLDYDAHDPWGARKADAFVAIAESYLSGGSGERKPHERNTVVIHADLEVLASGEGIGKIEGGGITPGGTIERLLCGGASIIEMLHKDGNIVHVDKKRRLPNVPMRRALQARDRCCSFPGCSRTARLQTHHTKWYSRNGDTVLGNLGLYCWAHHRLVHEGKVTIEKTDSGLLFRDSHGKVIAKEPLKATGPNVAELNRQRGVEISAETCLPGWGGEPGDLKYVADIYLINRHVSLKKKSAGDPSEDQAEARSGPDP